jgi:hypothetical protein
MILADIPLDALLLDMPQRGLNYIIASTAEAGGKPRACEAIQACVSAMIGGVVRD